MNAPSPRTATVDLDAVLDRHNVGIDTTDLVSAVEEMVREGWLTRTDPSKATLSKSAADFLAEHSGVVMMGEVKPHEAARWNTARVVTDTAILTGQALSTTEVADRLKIRPSSVRHRKIDGALYALPTRSGSLKFPRWQFQEDDGAWRVMPHLKAVLAALPEDMHPVLVADFFTEPRDWLTLNDEPMSVSAWLFSGGNVGQILVGAESYFVLG